MRENNNGLYRVDTFFFASNLVELPFDIILSSILMVMMYFLIDLNDDVKAFFYLVIINALMVQSGIALGMPITIVSRIFRKTLRFTDILKCLFSCLCGLLGPQCGCRRLHRPYSGRPSLLPRRILSEP
jgi:hypothetical protein